MPPTSFALTSLRAFADPADTIKAQQQVAKSEGLFGFYRGFGAVLSGVVPATALYFGGYESGKRLMPADYRILGDMLVGCYTQAIAGIIFTPVDIIKERMQLEGPGQMPGWGIGACSAGSAALAAWCTHPADVVKTRLQVLSGRSGGQHLRALDVAKTLWRSQGLRGFSQGLLARTLTIAPGAAIQWYIYESVKAHLAGL
ncbi:MAG: mitochondrial carrier family [Trebouxia sp. A1-2]|nr:MAG: mitochondrial carrier family [Trebouxia sp. A1-2]